jgi:hypothetical protein
MVAGAMAFEIPRPLSSYPSAAHLSLLDELVTRVRLEPLNGAVTLVFLLAVLHTFWAGKLTALAHRVEARQEKPSLRAELLHLLGEVEIVFGLWAAVLLVVLTAFAGFGAAAHYVDETVNYTEPVFVFVIMALASTRPVVGFAESALRRVAALGGGTPAAWWMTILTLGPVLGSFNTAPAAMTICALLLARQFYDLEPSSSLKYATLGLLFVNVSIGGTLTHFAAPPVLMVSRAWSWTTPFMLAHFGWKAVLASVLSAGACFVLFRKELRGLAGRTRIDVEEPSEDARARGMLPVPAWVVGVHLAFMGWTVFNAHHIPLFLGGFCSSWDSPAPRRPTTPAGPEDSAWSASSWPGSSSHGGLQGWWIGPMLRRLADTPLFLGATALAAFNDNAIITYLSTLCPTSGVAETRHRPVRWWGRPDRDRQRPPTRPARRSGPVLPDAISLRLLLGALLPTLIAALVFRLLTLSAGAGGARRGHGRARGEGARARARGRAPLRGPRRTHGRACDARRGGDGDACAGGQDGHASGRGHPRPAQRRPPRTSPAPPIPQHRSSRRERPGSTRTRTPARWRTGPR